MDTAVTRLRCERTGALPDYAPGAPPIWMYGVAYVSSDTASGAAVPSSPPPAYAPPRARASEEDVLSTFADVCHKHASQRTFPTHPRFSRVSHTHTHNSSVRQRTACCG